MFSPILHWLHISKTPTTRKKPGAYDVMPACHNLKIYSACNETPKLHLSKDRRYFSGVRDLAFASIRIFSSFQKIQWNKFCPKGKRHISRTGIDSDSQVSYKLKFLPTQNQKYMNQITVTEMEGAQHVNVICILQVSSCFLFIAIS